MKKAILLSLIVFCSACEKLKAEIEVAKVKEQKSYLIVCKHPFGHIVKYNVDAASFQYPANFRGGIWYFRTKSGLKVRSTFCHTEGF